MPQLPSLPEIPLPKIPSLPSIPDPGPFLFWGNESELPSNLAENYICLLGQLPVSTVGYIPDVLNVLTNLIEANSVYVGNPVHDSMYGEADDGQIIIQEGLVLPAFLGTMMHEAAHIWGSEMDHLEDYAGITDAIEDLILDSIQQAQNPPFWGHAECCSDDGVLTLREITSWEHYEIECEAGNICEDFGETLLRQIEL